MTLIAESNLRSELERWLHTPEWSGASIVDVRRRPNPNSTLAPVEQVSLTLNGGRQVEVFLKHLDIHDEEHPNKQVRDREILVYQELFGSACLPVPRCYGSTWDTTSQSGWLALEQLDGWCLKYHDLDRWYEAARCLGRFQRHFADRLSTLNRAEYLLKLDEAYFDSWFLRAEQTIERISSDLARELSPVIEKRRNIGRLLSRHCTTLVNNDLAPKNVIASLVEPFQIHLIDWEMAGVGCGLIDLVQLKDGLDPSADRKMREIYCAEIEGCGLLPENVEERRRLFDAADLHKTTYRLARCAPWNLPHDTLRQWIGEARRLSEVVSKD